MFWRVRIRARVWVLVIYSLSPLSFSSLSLFFCIEILCLSLGLLWRIFKEDLGVLDLSSSPTGLARQVGDCFDAFKSMYLMFCV